MNTDRLIATLIWVGVAVSVALVGVILYLAVFTDELDCDGHLETTTPIIIDGGRVPAVPVRGPAMRSVAVGELLDVERTFAVDDPPHVKCCHDPRFLCGAPYHPEAELVLDEPIPIDEIPCEPCRVEVDIVVTSGQICPFRMVPCSRT